MTSVRPFRFTDLPRYSAEAASIQRSFSAYLTQRPFQRDFLPMLGVLVEDYVKSPCRFSDLALDPLARGDLSALFPITGCFIALGAAPTDHKILVDLDATIANVVVEHVLGGQGDAERAPRPLTEIEQGVLSFVILKVIAAVHAGWQSGREIALSLDRFASGIDELRDIIDSESGYYRLGASFAVGQHIGYVRVLLPFSLITSSFRSPLPQSDPSREELAYMQHVFRSLPVVTVSAVVEAARLALGEAELAQLEAGDIIVLDDHELALGSGTLVGYACVRLGRGKNGGLRVRLHPDGERSRIEIVDIVVQEEPQEESMDEHDEAPADEVEATVEDRDNLAGTENLLRDVPAPVVVELSRISMSTSQVVRLRAGQILRLPRGAHDPVDLTVHGQLFARGELIEVEGELGVRLLKVVGAPGPSS